MEFLEFDLFLLPWLGLLGLLVGFLTGLFGIGGAFITTPVLIILGLSPSVAVGCSMGFTLVNGAVGLRRHSGMGNFEPGAMWPIAISACVGTLIGFLFHNQLAEALGPRFETIVNLMFCIILVPIGFLVLWQSESSATLEHWRIRKIPPTIKLRQGDLTPVSLPLLATIGLVIGLLKGMLGIGGGIILVPILVVLVGMSAHRAIGTSLGMVVLSSIVGTSLYAWNGDINLPVIGAMLTGSLLGVILGSRFCNISTPQRLKRLLVTLILGFSVFLAYQVYVGFTTPIEQGMTPTEESTTQEPASDEPER